jgi:hypothetical protein
MDCAVVDLVGYHFATLPDAEREQADEHLVGCTACLRAYLALKHRCEERAQGDRPSEEARLRLRRAVEVRFRPTRRSRVGAWLGRPIPLYQGLAAAAIAVLLASLVPLLAKEPPRVAAGPYVDTSRRTAESVTIY